MITTYLHLHIVIFNKSDTYNYFFIITKNKKNISNLNKKCLTL